MIIQGDSENEVNIVGCDNIEQCEGKKFELRLPDD
jgi:hypothetical protein